MTAAHVPFARFLRENAHWLGAGMLLAFLSSFGQTYFISVFAGALRGEFGLSHGAWGGIYSLGTTASAVVMLWAGGLVDRFRVRAIGTVTLLGLAAACLFMAAVPSVYLLPFVIFALRFTGQGMTSHIAIVAMARWFVATRGRALAIATLGYAIGEAILPVTFVWLMRGVDWRVLWVVAAGIALLGIPILMRLLQTERTPQSDVTSEEAHGMAQRHWTRGHVLRHWLFWLMIPAILGPSAFMTAFFFQQVHLAEVKGWSHVELVALFPIYTVTGIVSMFASGWALDRFGTARLLPFVLVPLAGSFAVMGLTTSYVAAAGAMALMGMTTGANHTVIAAFWAEFYGTRHLGAIKAMGSAVMVLGSAIGPGLTGILIDLGYGFDTQMIWIAVYFLAAAACVGIGVGRAKVLLPRAAEIDVIRA